MVTFQISYKKRIHTAMVESLFVEMAQRTSGTYTCDGHNGTVTCPDKYVWLLNNNLNSGWIERYTKVQTTIDVVG